MAHRLDHDQIIALARDGLSRSEIMREVGCSYNSVDYVCSKHGVKTPAGPRLTNVRSLEIVRVLLQTEIPVKKISKEFDMSERRIWQLQRAAEMAGFQFPHRNK